VCLEVNLQELLVNIQLLILSEIVIIDITVISFSLSLSTPSAP
jgi:hypothetical protein